MESRQHCPFSVTSKAARKKRLKICKNSVKISDIRAEGVEGTQMR